MIKERFSENLVVGHQKRAINIDSKGVDFLAKRIAEDFALRIGATNRQFSQCIDMFSLSDCVYQATNGLDNVSYTTRFERAPIAAILNRKFNTSIMPMPDDQLHSVFTGIDLLVSALGLHWHNDLKLMLSAACKAMKKDAMVLIALPARGTLFELQDSLTKAELELCGGASSRIDQFIDLQQAGDLLHVAGFKLPVIDQEKTIVRYDDIYAVIRDLRGMGATFARKLAVTPKYSTQLFKRANELYLENHSDKDGRIRLSFCIAYLTAWSPDESQQKPLKPGSAKMSLSKYLGSN